MISREDFGGKFKFLMLQNEIFEIEFVYGIFT